MGLFCAFAIKLLFIWMALNLVDFVCGGSGGDSDLEEKMSPAIYARYYLADSIPWPPNTFMMYTALSLRISVRIPVQHPFNAVESRRATSLSEFPCNAHMRMHTLWAFPESEIPSHIRRKSAEKLRAPAAHQPTLAPFAAFATRAVRLNLARKSAEPMQIPSELRPWQTMGKRFLPFTF